jgi:hypothetical protein
MIIKISSHAEVNIKGSKASTEQIALRKLSKLFHIPEKSSDNSESRDPYFKN